LTCDALHVHVKIHKYVHCRCAGACMHPCPRMLRSTCVCTCSCAIAAQILHLTHACAHSAIHWRTPPLPQQTHRTNKLTPHKQAPAHITRTASTDRAGSVAVSCVRGVAASAFLCAPTRSGAFASHAIRTLSAFARAPPATDAFDTCVFVRGRYHVVHR
jgi:hypothetical protein